MVELSNNVLQKGWVLFQSQGICLQQFGLGGGGFFFILLGNVEVSGMVPLVPVILGITQCFRELSQ